MALKGFMFESMFNVSSSCAPRGVGDSRAVRDRPLWVSAKGTALDRMGQLRQGTTSLPNIGTGKNPIRRVVICSYIGLQLVFRCAEIL